jgi:hypothetical protein
VSPKTNSTRALCILACAAITVIQLYVAPAVAVMLAICGLLLWAAVRPASANVAAKIGGLVVFYFAFWIAAGAYLRWIDAVMPMKYEPLLMRLETYVPLSRACAIAYGHSHALRVITNIIYLSLAYVMIAFYGWHLMSPSGRPTRLLLAFVLAFCVGPLLYPLLPACGPVYAFPGYPKLPAHLGSTMPLSGLPNCVPSLHMVVALLLVFYRLPGRFSAWASGLFAAGTAWATLATGEHYAVDLLVAIPFTVFVALAVERRRSAVLWLAGVVLVLAGIRFAA